MAYIFLASAYTNPFLRASSNVNMTFRVYIVPLITVDRGLIVRGPKYFYGPDALVDSSTRWGCLSYGKEPVFLVGADVSVSEHALLAANSDVLSAPLNLDNNLGAAAVTATQNFLESLNIPAGWVDTDFTFRSVIRRIAGIFQFNQRFYGATGNNLFDSVDLTRVFNTLSVAARQRVRDTALSLGLDISAFSATWTIRQILGEMGRQFDSRPVRIGRAV